MAESSNFILAHEYESVFVINRATGEQTHAGDHYGDPQCGVIFPDESWFATGGDGVAIFNFQKGMQNYLRNGQPHYFISAMRYEPPNSIRILVDPWSDIPSVWILTPTTGDLIKLHDGPDLRNEEYRGNVSY